MTDLHYEYKTISNPNSYFLNELTEPGHKFYYIKRRSMRYQSKFTAFKPKCKCKHTFLIWHHTRAEALDEYNEHVKLMRETQLTLC